MVSLLILSFASVWAGDRSFVRPEEPLSADRPGSADTNKPDPGEKVPPKTGNGGKPGRGGKGEGKGKGKGKMDKDPWTGPFKKKGYPTELIRRPLTLPKGMGEVSAGFGLVSVDTGSSSSSATGLGMAGRYGFTDDISAGVATGFALSPNAAWSEGAILSGDYLAVDGKGTDLALGLDLGLGFASGASQSVTFDVATRIRASDMVWFEVGENALTVLIPGGGGDAVGSLAAILGVGVQATDSVAVTLHTLLFTAPLFPSTAGATWLGDFIPVTLTGTFTPASLPELDVVLSLGTLDLVHATQVITFGLGAAYRF